MKRTEVDYENSDQIYAELTVSEVYTLLWEFLDYVATTKRMKKTISELTGADISKLVVEYMNERA